MRAGGDQGGEGRIRDGLMGVLLLCSGRRVLGALVRCPGGVSEYLDSCRREGRGPELGGSSEN